MFRESKEITDIKTEVARFIYSLSSLNVRIRYREDYCIFAVLCFHKLSFREICKIKTCLFFSLRVHKLSAFKH